MGPPLAPTNSKDYALGNDALGNDTSPSSRELGMLLLSNTPLDDVHRLLSSCTLALKLMIRVSFILSIPHVAILFVWGLAILIALVVYRPMTLKNFSCSPTALTPTV